MTDLALQFNGLLGWQFMPDQAVSGFDATVQTALVNLAQERGASKMHPDSGTDLLRQGLFGLMVDINTTRHAANFAAAETQEFVNNNTPQGQRISSLYLQPENFAPPLLSLNAMMVSTNNEERGTLLTS